MYAFLLANVTEWSVELGSGMTARTTPFTQGVSQVPQSNLTVTTMGNNSVDTLLCWDLFLYSFSFQLSLSFNLIPSFMEPLLPKQCCVSFPKGSFAEILQQRMEGGNHLFLLWRGLFNFKLVINKPWKPLLKHDMSTISVQPTVVCFGLNVSGLKIRMECVK